MTALTPPASVPNVAPAMLRRCLIDTNVLLRAADTQSAEHTTARAAVASWLATREELCIAPQNLIEFWAVATRPQAVNGLGWTPARCITEVQSLRATFLLLPDTPAILPQWERLVGQYSVQGTQAHDCRLVAVMLTHGVSEIMTFNAAHFRRYETAEGITVINPASVPSAQPGGTAST